MTRGRIHNDHRVGADHRRVVSRMFAVDYRSTVIRFCAQFQVLYQYIYIYIYIYCYGGNRSIRSAI